MSEPYLRKSVFHDEEEKEDETRTPKKIRRTENTTKTCFYRL